MLDSINEPVIFSEAEDWQVAYLRRYYMERWRDQQEAELRKMVEQMSAEAKQVTGMAPPNGWMRVAMRYICQRCRYLEKPKTLISMLASMDDEALFLMPASETEKKYVRWIRDYARRYTK